MGKPHVVIPEETRNFNNALKMKGYLGRTITSNDLFKFLKQFFGYQKLQREVAKSCFVNVEHGKYFIPDEFISINKLQKCYDDVSQAKKVDSDNTNSIKSAIKVLKEHGYIIYKESLDVEKALQNPTKPVELFIVKEFV